MKIYISENYFSECPSSIECLAKWRWHLAIVQPSKIFSCRDNPISPVVEHALCQCCSDTGPDWEHIDILGWKSCATGANRADDPFGQMTQLCQKHGVHCYDRYEEMLIIIGSFKYTYFTCTHARISKWYVIYDCCIDTCLDICSHIAVITTITTTICCTWGILLEIHMGFRQFPRWNGPI